MGRVAVSSVQGPITSPVLFTLSILTRSELRIRNDCPSDSFLLVPNVEP